MRMRSCVSLANPSTGAEEKQNAHIEMANAGVTEGDTLNCVIWSRPFIERRARGHKHGENCTTEEGCTSIFCTA